MMMWSTTRTPTISPASAIRRVKARGSRGGSRQKAQDGSRMLFRDPATQEPRNTRRPTGGRAKED